MVGTGKVGDEMIRACDVGLSSGVTVGSGVFVAGGIARAVCVYSAAIVPATKVKAAFISGVGACGSGEPHADRTNTKAILTRRNGE